MGIVGRFITHDNLSPFFHANQPEIAGLAASGLRYIYLFKVPFWRIPN